MEKTTKKKYVECIFYIQSTRKLLDHFPGKEGGEEGEGDLVDGCAFVALTVTLEAYN